MSQNPLYPVFLKLHQLNMLIVGAGAVGYEKLSFILKSSPEAKITVVAPEVSQEVWELLYEFPHIKLIQRPYLSDDLRGKNLAIAATDIRQLNQQVQQDAKARGILINVADTPDLCDFYLGSIVTRGDLKVAISTNGKSPTFAKRFRQVLEEILPNDSADLLNNLKQIRDRLKGSFAEKVKALNDLTQDLLTHQQDH